MFLRINKYKTVKTTDIIGIFDADSATMGNDSRKFLSRYEKEKRLISCGGDIPKSFVLYRDPEDNKNKAAFMKFSSSSVKNKIEAEEKLFITEVRKGK